MPVQHNWTGNLALHAASSSARAALTLTSAVKGVNAASSSKSSGTRGAWLKAATHARLRLHAPAPADALQLSLHIQDHVLLQAPLTDAHLRLAVLPAPGQQTSVLVLLPTTPLAGTAAPSQTTTVSYCFAFFDQPDCDSFTSALQAMMLEQQRQRLEQPAGHGHGLEQPASDAAAAATAAVASASQARLRADAKQAVERFLLDPDFQRLVEEVEAVWDDVQAELAGQEMAIA